MKNFMASASSALLATALVGLLTATSAPAATASEDAAGVYTHQSFCFIDDLGSYDLEPQVCQTMLEEGSALSFLGDPVTVSKYGVQASKINRLSTYYFSQEYKNGVLVYYMDTGELVPMSKEVYKFWVNARSDYGYEPVFTYGAPQSYSLVNGQIVTYFNSQDESGYYLTYDAQQKRVVSLLDAEGSLPGWKNSLSFGGGSLYSNYSAQPKTYISAALTDAGYAPYFMGNASAGLAVEANGANLYDEIAGPHAVLPGGTPWVLSVAASPADADPYQQGRALYNARLIARKLKQTYPHSQVVFQGVTEAGDPYTRYLLASFNDRLERVAQEEGAGFVDVAQLVSQAEKGPWVDVWDQDLTQRGQTRFAYQLKWAVRHAIGE